ncbi:MAG: hypothetical protein LIO79_09725 [Rikenellaceae bacterium]|nr:hypothetical protein [Rikenellaceae bacterium]
MIYNVVDSVKGGCGKTTFSIMLALALDDMKRKKKPDIPSEVCLVDVDIQGTALKYLLMGEKWEDRDFMYVNEAIKSRKDEKKSYITSCEWKNQDAANPANRFGLILCDPRQKAKSGFRAASNQNYTPEIRYSTFREGLKNMIADINGKTQYTYRHIIFDMPPNSDGYSDAVFDIMLNNTYTVKKEEDICNLFFVQTLDKSQRIATMDHFLAAISQENLIKADHIFFVCCNIGQFQNDSKRKAIYSDIVAWMRTSLRNGSFSESDLKKIFFVGIRFYENYYQLCTLSDAISQKEIDPDFKNPVEYLACMDETVELKLGETTEQLLAFMKEKTRKRS